MTVSVTYRICYVATRGRASLLWTEPDPSDRKGVLAANRAAQLVRSGEASLAVVCECRGKTRLPLESHVYPDAARKAIRHWLDVWDACEGSTDA